MSETITVREGGSTTFTAPASPTVERSAGILSTARAATGPIVNREPGPKDIVTIAGGEMTLEQAERMGFVSRNAEGRYQDLSAEATEAAIKAQSEQRKKEVDMSGALKVDAETAEGVRDLVGALRESGANDAAVVGELLSHPDRLPAAVEMLARDKGIDPADALSDLRNKAAAVEAAITDHLIENADLSEDQIDAFWHYMTDRHRDILPTLALEAIYNHNVRVWDKYVVEFNRSQGYGRGRAKLESVTRETHGYAGAKVEQDYVVVNGIKTSVAAARRAGLI